MALEDNLEQHRCTIDSVIKSNSPDFFEFFAFHRCHDDDDDDDDDDDKDDDNEDDHEQNVRWLQRKVRCIRMKYKETPAADKFLELRVHLLGLFFFKS
ncbi:hypothetical protein V1477_006921 [Vespula maculifrons]|uniref:Uncharacterized protein n=1 Tax=Vespula maculifrons TaxID=7453 RepID=A0ABD2CHL3_VESMC